MEPSNPNPIDSAAQLLAKQTRLAVEPKRLKQVAADAYLVTDGDGRQRLVVADDDAVRFHLGLQPKRARGLFEVAHASSFCSLVARYYAPHCLAIYRDDEARQFTAVLNGHYANLPGSEVAPIPLDAGWGDLRVVLELRYSPQFDKWSTWNRRQMSQAEFADFIEDNIADIQQPSGAEMLEIAQSITATTTAKFDSSLRLQDGSFSLMYHEDVATSAGKNGKLKVPASFVLGIPIFEGMDAYKVTVRLRTRIHQGSLRITPIIDQFDALIRDAIGKVEVQINDRLAREIGALRAGEEGAKAGYDLEILRGTPPALPSVAPVQQFR